MAIAKATGPETPAETFARWLADGETWIGCFENHDLGHYDVGRRVCLPFDAAKVEYAAVGATRAPDHAAIGLGWRYVLRAKAHTVDEALAFLNHTEAN
jgi:hypothetical protein